MAYSLAVSPITTYVPLPQSYEFRVVEHVVEDKVVKVELQCNITNHDLNGNPTISTGWVPVPRVKINEFGNYI